jgi:5'-deoxynucleotidase YfbR-like HD superfamily hydrolase
MSYYITHSGVRINIAEITEADINLKDIAHHLTKICRYGGCLDLSQHYSVAQHSIVLSNYARDNGYDLCVQRALLMHDATEAYLGDIVSGLKELLPDYRKIERQVQELIFGKYQIETSFKIDRIVKEFDTCMVLDEARTFMPHRYTHFKEQLGDSEPLGVALFNERGYEVNTYYEFLRECDLLDIKD